MLESRLKYAYMFVCLPITWGYEYFHCCAVSLLDKLCCATQRKGVYYKPLILFHLSIHDSLESKMENS